MDLNRSESTDKGAYTPDRDAFVAGGLITRLLDKLPPVSPSTTDLPDVKIQHPDPQTGNPPDKPGSNPISKPTEGPAHPYTDTKTEKRERNDSTILIGGALLSSTHSAARWGLDKAYSQLPENARESMSWWKPHSEMLKKQETYKLAAAEARIHDQSAAKILEQHNNVLSSAKSEMELLSQTAQREIEANANAKKAIELINHQKLYVSTLADGKSIKPGTNIGTKAELEAGTVLFEKNGEPAKFLMEYQKYLNNKKIPAAKFFEQDVFGALDREANKLGNRALTTDADIALESRQHLFYKNLPTFSNGDLIRSQIGTPAELGSGQKLFIQGSEDGKILSGYADSLDAYGKSAEQAVKSRANLIMAESGLAKQILRGPGSLVGRTICGTGRGLLFAGAAIAVGYTVDQITTAMSKSNEK